MEIAEVKNDGRGRHTTSHRQLVSLGNLGLLIDTPGIRAVGMSATNEGVRIAFEDVLELASDCRYRDCQHGEEPGCAVTHSVEDGTLSRERLDHFLDLVREVEYQRSRKVARDRSEERRNTRGRKAGKQMAMRAKGRQN